MRYMIFTWMQVIDLPLPIHSRAVTRVQERRSSSVVNLVMMMVMGMMMRVLNDGDGNADEGDDNVTRVHERRSSSVVNLVMMVQMVMRVLIMLMRDWGGDGYVAYLGDKIQTGSAMLL